MTSVPVGRDTDQPKFWEFAKVHLATPEVATIPPWDAKIARSKSEDSSPAKRDGKTVDFANLRDLCHLKIAELAKDLQKYKERVVLPGDKRQSRRRIQSSFRRAWCFSVSDGHGKVLGHYLKVPGMAGETSDAVSAHT